GFVLLHVHPEADEPPANVFGARRFATGRRGNRGNPGLLFQHRVVLTDEPRTGSPDGGLGGEGVYGHGEGAEVVSTVSIGQTSRPEGKMRRRANRCVTVIAAQRSPRGWIGAKRLIVLGTRPLK